MATSFIQCGDTIDFANSGSAISSGDVVIIGYRQLGIALVDIAATTGTGAVKVEGVFELAKNTSDALVMGQKVWWNNTAKELTNDCSINSYFIGFAVAAAGASDTTGKVQLAPFAEEGARVVTLAATGNQTLNVGDFGSGDVMVLAPNTAALTLNLPSVATIMPGATLFIRKTTADAQAITLDPASSEQIAGGSTFATIDANGDLAKFVSTGSAWSLLHSTIA